MLIKYIQRNGGKTTQLVKLALDTNSYLVVLNINEISRIKQQFKPTPMMITFNEFITKQYYSKGIKNFIIDNADLLLQNLTSVPIIAASITPASKQNINYICKIIRGKQCEKSD